MILAIIAAPMTRGLAGPHVIFAVPRHNVFLVKLAYWLNY